MVEEWHRFGSIDFVRSSQQKQISMLLDGSIVLVLQLLRMEPQLVEFAKIEARPEMLNLLVVTPMSRTFVDVITVPARVDVRVTNRSSFPRCNHKCCDGKSNFGTRRWSQCSIGLKIQFYLRKEPARFCERVLRASTDDRARLASPSKIFRFPDLSMSAGEPLI